MTARYTIFVQELDADHEVALMEVNSNPQAIVDGLRAKRRTIKHSIFKAGPRSSKVPHYISVRVVDNGPKHDT